MATYIQSNSGIYKITNVISGKIYIGCTSNLRKRINRHSYELKKEIHKNAYLQKAWLKYGEENFIFEIIEECDITDLHIKEHYWVTKLKCLDKTIGYNIKPTDPNGYSIHSEETKEKLRIANKGKKPSDICIQKLKERIISVEHKEILKKSRENIDFKKVHREKRGKKIIDLATGIIYSSLSEVCDMLFITKGSLSRKLSGKRINKTTFKYI
jgi:group I intron endonuclease